eukprot:TRINITY_DN4557_c0_g1_i1.p1 TRINITY_DN4557_c0_g1~~TRINITY_DN4557_c0_g1_i1.p1  ORF type:complete len:157 (+),score=51.66 TRINITY_DN4557_c0_g1_i1:128-598(+)
MTLNNMTVIALWSFVAGVVAAFIGFGSSLMQAPILLHMNLSPLIVQSSIQVTLLATVTANLFQYLFLQILPIEPLPAYFFIALVGSYIGKVTLDYFVYRFQKPSLVAYSLACYATLTVLLGFGLGVYRLSQMSANDHEFRSLCRAAFSTARNAPMP